MNVRIALVHPEGETLDSVVCEHWQASDVLSDLLRDDWRTLNPGMHIDIGETDEEI